LTILPCTGCMTHKFVDDTTLSEFINKGEPSPVPWI